MTIDKYLDNSQALELAALAKTSPQSLRNGLTAKINETDNPGPNVIYCAAFYCGSEVTERLIELLKSEDDEIFMDAYFALLMIDDFRGLVPILRVYQKNQKKLEQIADITAVKLGNDKYVNKKTLPRALKHPNPDIKLSGAIAAASYEYYQPKAYDILMANYYDPYIMVREQVLIALAKIDTIEIARMFLDELKVSNGEIAEILSFALGTMGNSLPQLSQFELKEVVKDALARCKDNSNDIKDLYTTLMM